jgi:hypothetical protein
MCWFLPGLVRCFRRDALLQGYQKRLLHTRAGHSATVWTRYAVLLSETDDDGGDGGGDDDDNEYTNLCLSSLLPALSIHVFLTFHLLLLPSLSHYSLFIITGIDEPGTGAEQLADIILGRKEHTWTLPLPLLNANKDLEPIKGASFCFNYSSPSHSHKNDNNDDDDNANTSSGSLCFRYPN